jgi:hypothetical protein
MPHIGVIINRVPPATSDETDTVTASVTYYPPHDATEQEVAQMVKHLYKQVKNLGTGTE